MKSLLSFLRAYGKENIYPFHMPGHKRRLLPEMPDLIREIDLTELPRTGDLHDNDPEDMDVISEAEAFAAELIGSEETHFLVGGSSSGLLAAICGALPEGSKLAIARNCHQSVYHGIMLGRHEPVFIYPHIQPDFGICEGIYPQIVEKLWIKNPDIRAIILTSPSYEGICTDIRTIAKTAHDHDAILIVDEAHGAHLPFSDDFPESAVSAGADIVVQSTHKTLPALTQTALIHLNGERVDREGVRRMLRVFQSSSPSYVLMSSIDSAMRLMASDGARLMKDYYERLMRLRKDLSEMKKLRLLSEEDIEPGHWAGLDPGKIYIGCAKAGIGGPELGKMLEHRFCVQSEMETAFGVLFMSSMADDDEGFLRLKEALLTLDKELQEAGAGSERTEGLRDGGQLEKGFSLAVLKENREEPVGIMEALSMEKELSYAGDAAGRISGDFVHFYPPEIPILIPGEIIEERHIRQICRAGELGIKIRGISRGGSSES